MRDAMLRIGSVTIDLETGGHLGRMQTLTNSPRISRRHVLWTKVGPTRAEGKVLCPNGVVHRPHDEPRWRVVREGAKFKLCHGDQICLQRRLRRPFRGGGAAAGPLHGDLDPRCLFTFVANRDATQ